MCLKKMFIDLESRVKTYLSNNYMINSIFIYFVLMISLIRQGRHLIVRSVSNMEFVMSWFSPSSISNDNLKREEEKKDVNLLIFFFDIKKKSEIKWLKKKKINMLFMYIILKQFNIFFLIYLFKYFSKNLEIIFLFLFSFKYIITNKRRRLNVSVEQNRRRQLFLKSPTRQKCKYINLERSSFTTHLLSLSQFV